MRVADYIFRTLADRGIRHCFLITGGGAMHLNDAVGREPRIDYVCTHHEQAAAIAAEGYARATGRLAVVNVTSGPGGTNAMTGVLGQWLDSVPALYLSGQVKFETTVASVPELGLRQLGDQEINIVDLVRPITKYARMVTDPEEVPSELDRTLHLATTGRPGPVWLDIPLDVQGAPFDRPSPAAPAPPPPLAPGAEVMDRVAAAVRASERPVLVAGHGIRLAGAHRTFLDFVARTGVPVVTTFNGFDLLASDADQFIGRIGTLGSRGGNFALQNADLVLCLGTRNNIRQVSYNWSSFARHGRTIVVDVDRAELGKPTVRPHLPVHADAGAFLESLRTALPGGWAVAPEWLAWCRARRDRYPVVLDEYRDPPAGTVHPYPFLERLTAALPEDAVVVAANGTACVGLFQAGVVKAGQRVFWNSGCASMGYALPAALGAAIATGGEVVCITGDGSLQLNLQELQTIRHHRLPVKIVVLDNLGYSSIRQTQTSFFDGHYVGCDAASGVSFPDLERVAELYGMRYQRIDDAATMADGIEALIATDGATICQVPLCDYRFAPKLSSEKLPDGRIVSKPLEDLFPFLERAELEANMLVRDPEPER